MRLLLTDLTKTKTPGAPAKILQMREGDFFQPYRLKSCSFPWLIVTMFSFSLLTVLQKKTEVSLTVFSKIFIFPNNFILFNIFFKSRIKFIMNYFENLAINLLNDR